MKDLLKENFKKYFNSDPSDYYFSPGRVNLIGEHIDYNGGLVFPMAIDLGIFASIDVRSDDIIRVVSDGFNTKPIEFKMGDFNKTNNFTDYIKGVIKVVSDKVKMDFQSGFDIYMYSTLPSASGLSSSACLELLISHILNDIYNLNLSDLDLVLLSQKAEREFILVNCGIMDQFAIGMSKKNKAILLDTNTLDYSLVDFYLDNATLIIVNTNKPRALVESKYNERRAECDKALAILSKKYHKDTLCSYDLSELESVKDELGDTLYHRCRHVISENKRVFAFKESLEARNLKNLGELLKQSHKSLKGDYEVTGINLDTICSELDKDGIVIGSRMTGAGFGGCIVAIFDTTNLDKIDKVMNKVNKVYSEVTKLNLSYYVVKSSGRTGILNEDN